MRNRRYQALIQEKAELIAEGDRIHAAVERRQSELPEDANDEQRAAARLTAEERRRDDEINARLEEIGDLLSREERLREHERTMPANGARNLGEDPHRDPSGGDTENPEQMAGFHSVADFALAVRAASRPGAVIDPRLAPQAAPTNFHETGGTAGEGFLVPPAMRTEVWELVFSEEERDLINMVDLEPTESNTVELIADETTPWGSTGISANWRAEGTQMTPSKIDTDGRQVRLNELYAFVLATEEMAADAPRLNSRLTRGSARAIRYKASDAIMRGTGAGQPLGYLNSAAKVAVAKEGGQAADTIDDQNVLKAYSRIIGPGRAVWLANIDVMPQLGALQIGDQPMWFPPQSGLREAPGGFLLGRPIIWNEHCATLGDEGDLQFVNLDGYYATQKAGGIQFATSMHLYFDYNMQAFRWTFRLGGQPFLSAPVSPDNGSSTRSHFVVIAERA